MMTMRSMVQTIITHFVRPVQENEERFMSRLVVRGHLELHRR